MPENSTTDRRDRHTLDSALSALRRLGVRPAADDLGCFVLPALGPGIKGWGIVDYLTTRGVRFRRGK
jgi:hypothetical protein